MMKNLLTDRYGFFKMCSLSISDKTNRLDFDGIKKGDFTNVLYAICVDGQVMYLGKSKDFWKRIDTYRNAKYWKNAWVSNKNKTDWLEKAVASGKNVEFICRCYLNFHALSAEELMFIEMTSPPWNIQHNKENYEAFV